MKLSNYSWGRSKGMVLFLVAASGVVWLCESAQAGKVSDRTANFYKAQVEKYKDKEIRLDVTHLRPLTPAVRVEGVQFFNAYTYDTRENVPGGWIIVAAGVDEVPALLKRYGQAPEHGPRPLVSGRVETKDLRGKLVSPAAGVLLVDLVGDVKEKISEQVARALEREARGAQGMAGGFRQR